jgi:beta-galactosidase
VSFPPGFVWGSATSALQIEGALAEDGRGPSIWDDFCRAHPERIHGGQGPEVACDHYHRFREDVAWMRELGHDGYRFSIAWPRVVPDGDGAVNPRGLDFYDRLVDALLEAGIAPNATLYHWDLPSPLARRGGWESRETVAAFLRFAEASWQRLGDRVALWATLNEPGWTTLHGYITGLHPPGRQDLRGAVLSSHHLMLAHALAVALYGSLGLRGSVGIALNVSPVRPATSSDEDARAARIADAVLNRWYGDPVLHGRYPDDALALYDQLGVLPRFDPADLATIEAASVGFLGVNYYCPHRASADAPESRFALNITGRPEESCELAVRGLFRFVRDRGARHTDWAWEIDPGGLAEILEGVHAARPGLPIYITENGIGLDDRLVDGRVDDVERIAFLEDHLGVIARAAERGIAVRGYYMWSLMDNFSWLNGYRKRYGFLHVDRATLARTPKASAAWFRDARRRLSAGGAG